MSSGVPEKVIAVVVAHRRAAKLQETLSALAGQTRPPDRIVIVDSDAQPDVKEVLERWRTVDNVDIHVLGRNGGSAGSFAAGMHVAEKDPDAAWIAAFDDDAIPVPDCLERLFEMVDRLPDLGAVGALSKDESGEFAWPMYVLGRRDPLTHLSELHAVMGDEEFVAVAELAWHAVLLPIATLRNLGPPQADLFMWYEDVEYGLRLRRAGLTAYVVPKAAVDHPPPVGGSVSTRFLGVHLEVPVVTPSKAYLMTRNALVVRHEYMGWRFWPIDMPLTLLRGFIAARALPGPTLRILWDAVLRGVRDAARGRLGPPPAVTMALDETG